MAMSPMGGEVARREEKAVEAPADTGARFIRLSDALADGDVGLAIAIAENLEDDLRSLAAGAAS